MVGNWLKMKKIMHIPRWWFNAKRSVPWRWLIQGEIATVEFTVILGRTEALGLGTRGRSFRPWKESDMVRSLLSLESIVHMVLRVCFVGKWVVEWTRRGGVESFRGVKWTRKNERLNGERRVLVLKQKKSEKGTRNIVGWPWSLIYELWERRGM